MSDENHNPAAVQADTGQFLTFCLADEEYGLEILRVQEIKGYSKVTPLPNTPPEVKGVMNLRGTVVPIIDLRTRFGLDQAEYTRFTVIIVVTVGTKVVGLVVDAVSDVLNVDAKELVPTPDLGSRVDTTFLTGIARNGERLVSLLNIDRLVGATTGGAALTA
ncbi:Chemotaxis protein CheW [Gemmata obscuriglobus]|uniref:Chemotaxis protein CheW n=2 Tax=Gemmata TaxID=113 RepID=A0A2Z3H6P3_9BACT|nr:MULTISPECIES: chemotaxis protein CheW [Gemmata]AWM36640.1 chemotaxis protein CheW [Gemmata obscuriglobus]MDY3552888.1 chemotaxis protein CheW [Gemmata algarum]MDY3559259.1 chemotaxis protein CheW [Gemmata algarum]QEG30722.1 Chemotaxis protein CheW [Gemmata obscuriglobus]VTS10052.1 chemotaxis protein : Chemotaxis signal transduction protein CheW OS=Candidatus Nitrospira defluvii GN=cheW PE=4 SV=1: CheW [Gemmata obscuriglobus UQM 2246]